MKNLEMFSDILGQDEDLTEDEIRDAFLKSFGEAIEVIEKHIGDDEGREFGEFVKEYQDELIDMHFEHFTHEELVYLVKLENDPTLRKIRDFQQNTLAPKIEKHIADFIDKKAEEEGLRRFEERNELMESMKNDGLRFGSQDEEDGWDTGQNNLDGDL